MLDALGIEFREIIFVMINFIVLVLVLWKLLYGPFLDLLEKRRAAVREAFDNADAVNRRADEKMRAYEAKIADTEEAGREIIRQAKARAEKQAEDILAAAREEAEEIKAEAGRSIEWEKKEAEEQMRDEILQLSMLAASQILQRELTLPVQSDIIDGILAQTEKTQWQN